MATIAAAIIGAGATYYASRQANKRSRGERDAQKLMADNARLSSEYGRDLLGRSKDALDPVYDYYRNLATGDRSTLMQHYGDEIDNINSGSRRAYQTASELAPRSGIATESASRIPMENAAAIARLLRSGRREGIEGLGTLGTNWGSLGMAGLEQGGNAAGSILGFNAGRRNEARQAGIDAGDSAYAIFKLISDAYGSRQSGQNQNQTQFWSDSMTNAGRAMTGR